MSLETLENRAMLTVIAMDDNTYSVQHDQTLYGMSVLMNDYDSNMLWLTASLVSGPSNGTVSLNSDGTFTYTPNANYAGNDSFTYEATNGTDTDQAIATIGVTNSPPVASDPSESVLHDQTLFSFVSAYDLDLDALTYSVVSHPTHGVLYLDPSGSFTYIPDCGYAGNDIFSFSVTDGIASDTGTFTVSVTNNAPVANSGSESVPHDQVLSSSVSATDLDGDALYYSKATDPSHGTASVSASGLVSYTPNPGYTGSDSFTFSVTDGIATDTGTFTINVTNNAPTDIALSPASIDENHPPGTYVGSLSAMDLDSSETHAFALVGGTGSVDNAKFQIAGADLLTNAFLDFEASSSYSIRVRTTDVGGLTLEKALTVSVTNVNETPTDIALTNSSVDENLAAGASVGTLSATDPDTADSHTFALVAGAGDSGNANFQIVGNDLQTNATFNHELQDSYSIRIRATDLGGLSYEKELTITINNVNEAPVFNDFDPSIFGVQKSISFRIGPDRTTAPPNNLVFDLNATDPDGDTLIYSIVNQNSDNLFAIDPATGKITLDKELSEATVSGQVINVDVKDPGGLSDTGQLVLTIEGTSVGLMGDTQAIEGTSDQILLTFVRQSLDISSPLTVQFNVDWSYGSQPALSPSDFASTAGLTTLQSGSIVIPADATEVSLELIAPSETPPLGVGEGLERARITIVETSDYAVVHYGTDPEDPKTKKDDFNLFDSLKLEVLDGVALFVDGSPSGADGSAVHYNDVIQGHVGDCYFLAIVAGIAKINPGAIQSAISEDTASPEAHDYIVQFYSLATGSPYTVHVSLDLDRGFDAAQLSGDYDATGVEVWPQVLELAFAETWGGFGGIGNGGSVANAWFLLTGESLAWDYVAGPVYAESDEAIAQKIKDGLDASKAVLVETIVPAPDIVGDHVYLVLDFTPDGFGNPVEFLLYNPHGSTATIAVDRLNENIEFVYVGDLP